MKLKAAAVMTCKPGNGFELYRVVNKRMDPTNDVSRHTILTDVRRIAFMKAKDLSETKQRIIHMINLCHEYTEKLNELVPDAEKVFAVWTFMDDETKMRLERKGLQEGVAGFDQVCEKLELLVNEDCNKKATIEYARKTGPMPMDLSLLNRSAAGVSAAPIEGAEDQAAAGNDLDALSDIKCHGCGGMGHKQADCTSRPGVELACHTCGGWGHYGNECASKGKGKGKGKGKDDKGKGSDGWKGKGKGGESKGWGKGKGQS